MRRALVLVALAACASPPAFPRRAAVTRDTDLDPVSVACVRRPNDKDPNHVSCAPEPYVSPLAWDAADNTFFRPLAKIWAVDVEKEARNVNALDEVPDSAWFTNRLGVKHPSEEELKRGACKPEDMLDPDAAKEAEWVIDQGKPNGASPGFRVKIGGKKKYMFKTDFKKEPERPSAAAAIGTAAYHAVGFNTSCEQVLFVDPKVFKLMPGLKVTANDGVTRPFDEAALEKVFGEAVKREGRYRFQASAWLGGYLIGPFKYEGTRSDDPNDVIPHENRRDLRGGRLLAAWLHHFDAREQNSMDSWMAVDKASPESSPGWVKHYYLDTSDCLGSVWDWDGISRRMGDSYLLDWKDVGVDFITLGAIERPWERKSMKPGQEMFGYFHWDEFDPERWRNEYPNPAFSRATERDNAWMARILSRFDRRDIQALVEIGRFSKPEAEAFVTEVLEQRLRKIVARYLTVLSPIADLRVEGDALCGVDLARRRGVRPDADYTYRADPYPVRALAAGRLCVPIPRAKELTVRIASNQAKAPIEVQLYDDGSAMRIAGLVRRSP
ncbi:MAG: hypothetical protein KIT84_07210 [Labilithrix sp.]|nr:hypothetical protein [Labilithrix sp.]MCW5810783.1 hypothetical protein [Labilithrix sp.]